MDRQKAFEKFMTVNQEKMANLSIIEMVRSKIEPCFIELAIILGADLHEQEDEVLFYAVESEDAFQLLEIFKNYGMKFDTYAAHKAAIQAVRKEKYSIAKFFLDNGLDVGATDTIGASVLSVAIAKANTRRNKANYKFLKEMLDRTPL